MTERQIRACLRPKKDVLEDSNDCSRSPDQIQRPCADKRENLNACGRKWRMRQLMDAWLNKKRCLSKDDHRLSCMKYFPERFFNPDLDKYG